MNVVDHSCPTCGANLNFNPNTQNWICAYCKVQYALDELNKNINKYHNTSLNLLEEIECTNCGARVVTDSSTSSTLCTYCNSSVIIKKHLVGEYKPDYIIPFNKTKDQVIDIFMKHLNSKKLCSSKFKNRNNIKSITGLYVPFWLVSTSVLASIKGHMYQNQTFNRLGTMRLDKVPVDGKSNLDDDMLKGILPFDYSNMKDFEYPYLAGFYAERFDEDQKTIYENQIKEMIREVAIKKLTDTVPNFEEGEFGQLEQVTYHADNFEYKYVLVPVWFVKMEYEGDVYEYCINDSNNKISGKYPIGKFNKFIVYLSSIVISLLFILIFNDVVGIMLGAVILISLLTFNANYINSYSRYKLGEESTKYIIENSFKLISK